MKPLLKWSGGKGRELPIIQKYLPDDFLNDYKTEQLWKYIELFSGGAALAFHLKHPNTHLNDLNKNLVEFYRSVADEYDFFIRDLSELPNTESFYYEARRVLNGQLPSVFHPASIYAYLNRAGFSGLQRTNSKGEFNVPYGKYKWTDITKHFPKEASEFLKTTTLTQLDFRDIIPLANENTFIYADPPYLSDFHHYNQQPFGENEHIALANLFKDTPAKMMVHISDIGIIRELYKDYIVYEYEKGYSVNRMTKTESVKHLIITNYSNFKGEI